MQGAPSDQSRGELTSVNMNPSQLPSDNTSGPYMPTGVSWEDGAVAAAVKALHEVYAHLHGGGNPAALKDKIASNKDMDALVFGDDYKRYLRDFLRG